MLTCEQNISPGKELAKIYFVLEPYEQLLPEISPPGYDVNSLPGSQCEPHTLSNIDRLNRLNAGRMLRARKILQYVADRIEKPDDRGRFDFQLVKAEDYLELYCQNQVYVLY